MALLTIKDVAIKGISACVPKFVEENISSRVFATTDEAQKFIASTGVERRRIANENTTTADLCYHATEKLIADLNWSKESIDCLIFVTQTPDYILPATSCILQNRLGLSEECYALDISLGCSGWVYGLSVIGNIISTGNLKRGLLLAGDTISKTCSKKDKSSWPLFGDAGTATAIEFDESANDIKCHFSTDGAGSNAIIIPDGGYKNPTALSSLNSYSFEEGIERNKLNLVLNGMDVFSFGISKAPQSVNKLLEYSGIGIEDVDYFIFHQANKFMNEKIRKKLHLDEDMVPYSLCNFGNTSSASIPLTMVIELNNELKPKSLKHIGCGFGVGLSWGSVYFETNKIVVPDLLEV